MPSIKSLFHRSSPLQESAPPPYEPQSSTAATQPPLTPAQLSPDANAVQSAPPRPAPAQGPPLQFVVTRPGMHNWGRDAMVAGPTNLYLEFPIPARWLDGAKWDASLRRGGPSGPVICKMQKGSLDDSFGLTFVDGARVFCNRSSGLRSKYEFRSPSGIDYVWRADSLMAQSALDFSLYRRADLELPKGQRRALAQWTSAGLSFSKLGSLRVSPELAGEVEVLVVTALGVTRTCPARTAFAEGTVDKARALKSN